MNQSKRIGGLSANLPLSKIKQMKKKKYNSLLYITIFKIETKANVNVLMIMLTLDLVRLKWGFVELIFECSMNLLLNVEVLALYLENWEKIWFSGIKKSYSENVLLKIVFVLKCNLY